MWVGAQGNLELMTEHQVLEREISTRAEASQKTTSDEKHHVEHGSG